MTVLAAIMDEVLSLFSSLNKPVDFLDPPPELKENCLTILSRLSSLAISSCNDQDLSIHHLHTKGFQIEDIWQQIELINEPLICQANQLNLKSLAMGGSETAPLILCPTLIESGHEIETRGLISDEGESDDNDVSSEDEDSIYEEETRENIDTDIAGNSDCFFNMAEMESFVQQAEKDMTNDNSGGCLPCCMLSIVMFCYR